jgi:hypothetical protein
LKKLVPPLHLGCGPAPGRLLTTHRGTVLNRTLAALLLFTPLLAAVPERAADAQRAAEWELSVPIPGAATGIEPAFPAGALALAPLWSAPAGVPDVTPPLGRGGGHDGAADARARTLRLRHLDVRQSHARARVCFPATYSNPPPASASD